MSRNRSRHNIGIINELHQALWNVVMADKYSDDQTTALDHGYYVATKYQGFVNESTQKATESTSETAETSSEGSEAAEATTPTEGM